MKVSDSIVEEWVLFIQDHPFNLFTLVYNYWKHSFRKLWFNLYCFLGSELLRSYNLAISILNSSKLDIRLGFY